MKNEIFTVTYEKYKNLLMKIIYDRSGSLDVAEEITQQVFVAFYQEMERINEKFYKPWLMLTARNAVVDYQRKKRTKKEIPAGNSIGIYGIITENNTEKVVERMINIQLSFRILEDLREKNEGWYRVIEAICIQEMEHEEAAEYLRLTPQGLRAKLYRARKYIRQKYSEEYDRR